MTTDEYNRNIAAVVPDRTPVYISGPITGIAAGNFGAFIDMSRRLKTFGYKPINPHDIGKTAKSIGDMDWSDFMRIDIARLLECKAIVMLCGWRDSKGAMLEYTIAKALGMPAFDGDLNEITEMGLLEEAKFLVDGDRGSTYGTPADDFGRTAAMWSALKGITFSPEDVARFLICVKLSRLSNGYKRDSWVDIAGYAYAGHKAIEQGPSHAKEKE